MKCAEQIDNHSCFVHNEAENSCWRVIRMYLKRKVDAFLEEWKADKNRKPLIVKGSRQIGVLIGCCTTAFFLLPSCGR